MKKKAVDISLLLVVFTAILFGCAMSKNPKNETLVLKYSQKQRQYLGLDDKLKPTYKEIEGNTVVVKAKIIRIDTPFINSPGISAENTKIVFELMADQVIPKHPAVARIELYHGPGIMTQPPFKDGDVRTFVFDDTGAFVDVR